MATGGNLQPWHIDLLTGASLRRLKDALHKLMAGQSEESAYAICPTEPANRLRATRADEPEGPTVRP